MQWALAGRGIVLRSVWDVQPLLDAGRLQRVLPGVTQPANVWAVYPARLAQSAKVRACVEFLKDRLGAQGCLLPDGTAMRTASRGDFQASPPRPSRGARPVQRR